MGAKVLLIGLDSLGADELDRIIASGRAPTLARLRAEALRVSVENYPGFGEGTYWPSIATGLGPAGHGRYFCLEYDKRDYEVRPRDDRKAFTATPFWTRLDQEGLLAGVLDWPRSPLGVMRRGYVVDGWLAHDPVGPRVASPEAFGEELVTRYGGDPWVQGAIRVRLDTEADCRKFIEESEFRIALKARGGAEELRARDWDLYAPIFSDPHDVSHYLYHLSDPTDPRHDAKVAQAAGDPLLRMGAALDAAVAELIEAAGAGARVLLLGGPGMARLVSGNSAMDQITRQLDLGRDAEPSPLERARRAFRRYTPKSWRMTASRYVRQALRPALRQEIAGRRFFSVPHNDNAGCVRINLKGREPMGAVDPKDYDALLDQLEGDFLALRDLDTGAPAVEQVVRIRAAHSGPFLDDLPDLFVVWRRERQFARLGSDKVAPVEVAPRVRTGDHISAGFLWSSGPGAPLVVAGETLVPDAVHGVLLEAVRAAAGARAPAL